MRILILGASGYVGGVLYRELGARHEVVGAARHPGPEGFRTLDLTDREAVGAIAGEGFEIVIHAAGVVDLAVAEADPAGAWAVNAGSVEALAEALRPTSTRIVLFSSDNVFDGTRDHYTEADATGPINAYGRTKVAAEQAVLADDRHLALRIPIVYGRSPWSGRFMSRFAAPETPAQTDIVSAPVYLFSLPGAIEQLWDLTGIVHYAGPEIVTRFELMSRIQAALNLPTRVVPVLNDEAFGGYARPKRLVLRSIRRQVPSPDLATALAHMAAVGPAGPPRSEA